MRRQVQPIAEPTTWMRYVIDVEVEVDSEGNITDFVFDTVRGPAEFRFVNAVSMLMMNLHTRGPKNGPAPSQLARLASQPIQFKTAGTGQPIPVPEVVRVHRFGDFCCGLEVHGAVVAVESYSFHLVVVFGEKLVGSPDPTVIIEPPPCTGSGCDEPPVA